VQFHPERMLHDYRGNRTLFREFVSAAKDRTHWLWSTTHRLASFPSFCYDADRCEPSRHSPIFL